MFSFMYDNWRIYELVVRELISYNDGNPIYITECPKNRVKSIL